MQLFFSPLISIIEYLVIGEIDYSILNILFEKHNYWFTHIQSVTLFQYSKCSSFSGTYQRGHCKCIFEVLMYLHVGCTQYT